MAISEAVGGSWPANFRGECRRSRALQQAWTFERAAQICQDAKRPAHSHLHPTSDIHLKFKLKNRGSSFG